MRVRRSIWLVLPVLLSLAASGCATAPDPTDPDAVADARAANDPIEPANRVIFEINDGIDVVVLRPLALAWRNVVPEQVRDGARNALRNLATPVVLANDMLQGKPRRAGDTLMRFVINSTAGIGGLFDVATGMGYPYHGTDFGMTLALWGISEGPYLYLPLFGPSNPRDAVGRGVDSAADPFMWLGAGTTVQALGYARIGVGAVDSRSRFLDDLDRVRAQALDPYATIRSLFRQNRQSTIDEAAADDRGTAAARARPPAR